MPQVQLELQLDVLFESAVDEKTSPMQWIEDDSCGKLIVFMRAIDLQDFCFIADIASNGSLTITEHTLDDEPVTLSQQQLDKALSVMQAMYDDSVGNGCDYPYDDCTDHGMKNSDFLYGYSA